MPAERAITRPTIDCVARLGLVVRDLAATERFFVDAFDARTLGRRRLGADFGRLVGLPDHEADEALVAIGEQQVALIAFDRPGRPYPTDSTSTDLWFQHFAIIVADMDAAYRQLQRTGGFVAISDGGPVQLPAASGGVQAFKFRDNEGHPLELLSFPAGGGPDHWAARRDHALFLGIDHSAIAVSDTAALSGFFERAFGLEQSMQQVNVGPEQARMDAVADARVVVTGMAPRATPPHVEMLGYEVGSRRPIDGGTQANDTAATFFVLRTDAFDAVVEALTQERATFVSPGVVALATGVRAVAVLDPDGHRFIVEEGAASPT